MFDNKSISKAIRDKKKGSLRQDMDYAGQDAVDPNEALDVEKNAEVSDVLDENSHSNHNQDHAPISDDAMGENESSQDEGKRKKISARINKYFESL